MNDHIFDTNHAECQEQSRVLQSLQGIWLSLFGWCLPQHTGNAFPLCSPEHLSHEPISRFVLFWIPAAWSSGIVCYSFTRHVEKLIQSSRFWLLFRVHGLGSSVGQQHASAVLLDLLVPTSDLQAVLVCAHRNASSYLGCSWTFFLTAAWIPGTIFGISVAGARSPV